MNAHMISFLCNATISWKRGWLHKARLISVDKYCAIYWMHAITHVGVRTSSWIEVLLSCVGKWMNCECVYAIWRGRVVRMGRIYGFYTHTLWFTESYLKDLKMWMGPSDLCVHGCCPQRGMHRHAEEAHHGAGDRVQEAQHGHQAQGGPDPRAGDEGAGEPFWS